MARPGYVKTRSALYDAQIRVLNCESELSSVDTITINGEKLIPGLVEVHRKDWQRSLDNARLELVQAEAAFAAFSTKPEKEERTYFNQKVNVCLSLSDDMADAMRVRRTQDGIGTAELIRRALQAYLTE